MSLLARLGRAYSVQLRTKPLLVNVLTSAGLCAVGDCAAQSLEKHFGIQSHGKEHYNYWRTGRMMLWGACSGSMCTYWYPWLAQAAGQLQLTQWREIGFKLFFDQMFFQPLCINAFFTVTSALEGKTTDQIKAKLQNKVLNCWVMSVPVWCSIQMVNFKFVPTAFQPLVVYAGCLGYNTAMSLINHAQEYGTPNEQLMEKQLQQADEELDRKRVELVLAQQQALLRGLQLKGLLELVPEEQRAKAAMVLAAIEEAEGWKIEDDVDHDDGDVVLVV